MLHKYRFVVAVALTACAIVAASAQNNDQSEGDTVAIRSVAEGCVVINGVIYCN